jgi:signal transduction histidine kinase
MTTTIFNLSRNSPDRAAVSQALRDAGVGVVEVEDWDAAAKALHEFEAALVVCDGETLAIARDKKKKTVAEVPGDMMRSLSHELRTPLSAMAGWLHLLESGKLDEAGFKRAISRLRGNIDDQVRTIDRYLGNITTPTKS